MLTLVTVAILLQAELAEIAPLTPVSPDVTAPPAAVPPPSQPTAVLSILRPGAISEELASALEEEVRRALGQAGVNVQPDIETKRRLQGRGPAPCTANVACYSLLATITRSPVAVIIEASAVQQDLAVVLQAVSAKDSRVVAESSFVTPAATLRTQLQTDLQPFAAKVAEAASAAEPFPVEVADAPVKPVLLPKEKPAVVVPVAPVREPSRTPAMLTGIGALAAATVAIVFAGSALSAQSCLNGPVVDGRPTVCVSQDRAAAMQAGANRDIAVSAGAGAVSVALGAATAWLWSHP